MHARAARGSRARSRSPRSCRASRRWRTSRSPCRRAPARASASSARAARRGGSECAGAGCARRRSASPSAPHMPRRRTVARREARARACDRAGDGAEAAAARRADGRHRPRGDRPAGRDAAPAQGPLPDGAGRARHDGRVRARRPHLGADLRPHPRERHARAGARRSAGASPPISATRWNDADAAVEKSAGRLRPGAGAVRRRAFASAPARS